jgi:hypothetical protein
MDHDPTNNRLRNLRSLCQRCHLLPDRPHHLEQRRITCLLRRALGVTCSCANGRSTRNARPKRPAAGLALPRSIVQASAGRKRGSRDAAPAGSTLWSGVFLNGYVAAVLLAAWA